MKKYRAWSALGKVTVCVNVMVQGVEPDPVVEVLAVVPVKDTISLPVAAAAQAATEWPPQWQWALHLEGLLASCDGGFIQRARQAMAALMMPH